MLAKRLAGVNICPKNENENTKQMAFYPPWHQVLEIEKSISMVFVRLVFIATGRSRSDGSESVR